MDQRFALRHTGIERLGPGDFQFFDISLVDLRKGAVAPIGVTAPPHQPIAICWFAHRCFCYGRPVIEWRYPGRLFALLSLGHRIRLRIPDKKASEQNEVIELAAHLGLPRHGTYWLFIEQGLFIRLSCCHQSGAFSILKNKRVTSEFVRRTENGKRCSFETDAWRRRTVRRTCSTGTAPIRSMRLQPSRIRGS